MNAIRTRLPSPAMIVACVALVVALGGVSYAATVLPKDSVGTIQLKKKAVTASKLRKNSVTGAKVRDSSLVAADFKPGQLPAGPRGAQGPKGDPGLSGVAYVEKVAPPIPPGGIDGTTVQCPAGTKALSGGVVAEDSAPIVESFPTGGEGWSVLVRNDTGHPVIPDVWAVCAKVG
jgi:hypothetical protein